MMNVIMWILCRSRIELYIFLRIQIICGEESELPLGGAEHAGETRFQHLWSPLITIQLTSCLPHIHLHFSVVLQRTFMDRNIGVSYWERKMEQFRLVRKEMNVELYEL
jgi:hypothetical protein